MITFVRKLVKIGNSKGFRVDKVIVRSERLVLGKVYKITIEEI